MRIRPLSLGTPIRLSLQGSSMSAGPRCGATLFSVPGCLLVPTPKAEGVVVRNVAQFSAGINVYVAGELGSRATTINRRFKPSKPDRNHPNSVARTVPAYAQLCREKWRFFTGRGASSRSHPVAGRHSPDRGAKDGDYGHRSASPKSADTVRTRERGEGAKVRETLIRSGCPPGIRTPIC
jgi:hypothetical protein